MAEPTEVLTHVDDGVGHLASQYRSAQNLTWLVEALLTEVQEVEGVLFDLRELHSGNATGDLLDIYGALAGVDRDGFTDAEYRRLIYAEYDANTSTGRASDLIALLEELAADPTGVVLREYWPAQVSLEYSTVAPSAAFRLLITPLLQRAAASGVLVDPVVEAADVDASGFVFGFFNDPDAGGYGVGQFATLATGPLGDSFYYDLADGLYEVEADVLVGDPIDLVETVFGVIT